MNRRMLFVFALLASTGAAAAQTLLNFEAPPQAPAKITTQYGPQGVIFQSAFLRTDPAAHSGTQVLQSGNPSDGEFDPGPFVITFTSPQSHVKFFADSMGSPADHILKAFDGNGNLVAQDGPRTVAQDVFTTSFEVNVPTPTITRLEFLLINSGFEVIDDLEFQGEPPGPTPTEPPVVQLIRPINGLELDIPDDIPVMDINGTVTGDGLISPVIVTVANLQPPESTAPPLNLALDLTGTGTTRQFALAGGIAQVPLGPITVTATAENTGNLKGTATSTFNNFPAAIRNRFISEGGAAVLGNFQFGLFAGTCRIAVYEHAAISAANGGAILIHGAIFDKWMSLRSLSNPTSLGCPQNEEHDAPIGFGAREQDFVGGRIYANVPGIAPPGTAYVPAVFRDAIEKRGTELVFGLPMADPTDSIGPASLTWLFQRFLRPGESADLLPSTLEIRNSPPVLLMERQLGPWFLGSFGQSPFDIDRHKSPATLWETFPCGNNLGPCPVPDEPPFPPPNIDNAGELFCNGITYVPTLEGTTIPNVGTVPPEWRSVRGQYDVTPVFGAIISAHMTDIDNGFTHETHNGNCPYFPNILEVLSTVTCVSDFEFFVRPIGPQVDTSPLPSLFGHDNKDRIKTEYEVSYLALAHNFLGAPAVGDLVHTTGRWIVDCGHATYKTELHPIFSYARMKTVISETNAFTGLEDDLFNGRPATRVGILVNGWFPGGDNNAIEFDAFPPPRPSPDAVLHVVKPVDNAAGGYQAAEDVTMEFQFVPPGTANHIHLKFTSPRRENTVTAAGEMKFDSGRQYWGIWYLYWGN
jgi:hypothetical protein